MIQETNSNEKTQQANSDFHGDTPRLGDLVPFDHLKFYRLADLCAYFEVSPEVAAAMESPCRPSERIGRHILMYGANFLNFHEGAINRLNQNPATK